MLTRSHTPPTSIIMVAALAPINLQKEEKHNFPSNTNFAFAKYANNTARIIDMMFDMFSSIPALRSK